MHKNIIFIGSIIVLSLIAIFYFTSNTPNDPKTLIEKGLTRQFDEVISIQILDSVQFEKYALVGFAYTHKGEKLGYAIIEKENDRNYVYQLYQFERLRIYTMDVIGNLVELVNEQNELVPFRVIMSLNPELLQVRIGSGGSAITYPIDSPPSFLAIRLPSADSHYEFLDKDGEVMMR